MGNKKDSYTGTGKEKLRKGTIDLSMIQNDGFMHLGERRQGRKKLFSNQAFPFQLFDEFALVVISCLDRDNAS